MSDESYTPEWYEKQYKASNWSKKHSNVDAVLSHFRTFMTTRSIETQKSTPNEQDVSYGEGARQKIDYLYCGKSMNKLNKKPVFAFIHGGYWQEENKETYSAVINSFTKHGFNGAVIGYDLAPGCSISEIVVQVIEAGNSIHSHFNQSKLVIIGHCAGAFLAAAMARSNPSIIQNVVLISGVYDLSPLLNTSMNEALRLTKEQAQDLSSMVYDYNVAVPAYIYVGGDESPEFKKQSRTFYENLVQNKIPCEFKVVPNEDHFSIIENITDENFVICREMLHVSKAM